MIQISKAALIILFAAISRINEQPDKKLSPELAVLRLAKTGKIYKFNSVDSSITYLRYIGSVQTRNGVSYKVITSVWLWGLSHRATNRILIYNHSNAYVGNYKITAIEDLPVKIENNGLIVNYPRSKRTCKLNLDNGLPQQLYNECAGDIYVLNR